MNAANCSFDIKNFDELVEHIINVNGDDKVTASKLVSTLKSDGFIKAFSSTIENMSKEFAYETLVNYYNIIHPDVHLSVNRDAYDSIRSKGSFDSVLHRQFGLRQGANLLSRLYVALYKENKNKKYKTADYVLQLKNKIGQIASKRHNSFVKEYVKIDDFHRFEIEEIKKNDKLSKEAKIIKILSLSSNATDRFWASMLDEAFHNTADFYNDIRLDSRLQVLDRKLANDEYKSEELPTFSELIGDLDRNLTADEEDRYLNHWEGSLGDYTNAMKHIDSFIRSYFNGLTKLRDTSRKQVIEEVKQKDGSVKKVPRIRYNEDTDNISGMADTMNAEECVAILYKFASNVNADEFVRSIENIAKNHKGFEGLIKLADDLQNDSDMKYFFYTTFGKELVTKSEVAFVDGHFTVRTSNENSDKLTALRNQFFNNLRHSALSANNGYWSAQLDKINNIIKGNSKSEEISKMGYDSLKADIRKNTIELNKTKDDETKAKLQKNIDLAKERVKEIEDLISDTLNDFLLAYVPGLDYGAVDSYLFHDDRYTINFNKLVTLLNKIVTEAIKASDLRSNIDSDLAKLRGERKAAQDIENSKTGQIDQKAIDEINNKISELSRQEYISDNLKKNLADLADTLLDYTTVKSDLNSRDVHGHLSSDVFNNNMLSFLKHTFRDANALNTFLESRLLNGKNLQYQFSNIMIEEGNHASPDKYGLFYWQNGVLRATDYAKELIKSSMFNGAINSELESAANYAEISKGDLVAAAFVSFFNVGRTYTKESIPFANYLLRTQSDAPHNFYIRAPKYSIKGLYSIDNAAELNAMSDAIIGKFKVNESFSDGNGYRVGDAQKVAMHFTSEDFGDIILGKEAGSLKNAFVGKVPKEGEQGKIRLTYIDSNKQKFNYYMVGTHVIRNGYHYLTSSTAEPLSVESRDPFSGPSAMPKEVLDAIRKIHYKAFGRSNQIEYTINTKHRVFNMFRNMLKQELTDAGNAIHQLFVLNEDGTIAREHDDETGTEKPKLKDEYKGEGIVRTYDIYHHNKDKYGKITARKNEKGEWVNGEGDGIIAYCSESHDGYLAGRWYLTGRVFESDKFVLYYEDYDGTGITNYGEHLQSGGHVDFLDNGLADNYLRIKSKKEGSAPAQYLGVEFTPTLLDGIDKLISIFLANYTEEVNRRMSGLEKFLPEAYRDVDVYREFAINYHIMYNNFNDLLEGDTKFYKNAQDILKRAKEDQAGGTPFGVVDYTTNPNAPIKDIPSVLDNESNRVFITTKNGNRQVKLRNGFTAITIKNTVRQSEDSKDVIERLRKNFEKERDEDGNAKYTEEEINKIIKGFQKAYSGVKTNDAQSYITLEEWIRRVVASGQYKKYKSLIDALTGKRKLEDKDMDEFVQVQKNFYYDIHYNKEFGICVPRQIKNAEFVLIPQFIKGTPLEKVYDFMVDKEIDQLNTQETSKAGKANVFTIWNDDGIITDKNWAKFWLDFHACPEAVEQFSYNNLYKQQEVPQHVDAENKAGIQIMKKLIDNIPDKGHVLSDAKKRFFDLYTTNIKHSFISLSRSLNLLTDKNGNLVLDENGKLSYDKRLLYNKLLDEAKRLGVNSNELEYLQLEDDGVTPKMPTYFTIFSNKLENIVQSMFNNEITRQTLPGFHAAQVTGVGIATLWKGKEGKIQTDNTLRYFPDGKPYIEVVVPKPKCFDGISTDEALRLVQESKLDEFIGYRIPTEGKQSVAVMKIVGFLEKEQGSTIIVPDDWVAQTGADFDVDSIYAIMKRLYYNKRTKKVYTDEYTSDDNNLVQRYQNYVLEGYKDFRTRFDSSEYDERKSKIKKGINEEWNENVDNFNKEVKKVIDEQLVGEHDLYAKLSYEERKTVDNILQSDEKYIDKIYNLLKSIAYAEEGTPLGDFKAFYQELYDFLEGSESNLNHAYAEKNSILGESLRELKFEFYKAQASNLGLLSFEDFSQLSIDEQNTKDTRDTAIIDTMLEILRDPDILEQILSTSNFRDVVAARDSMMSKEDKIKRKARSAYNFFDQLDYQEEVMSGAKLKALSVSRDTFCSVGNKTHAVMAEPIEVVYPASQYSLPSLKSSFDTVDVVRDNNGKVVAYKVRHANIGWSKDNRNVAGKYITIYSSQTTAHHLDAVKEGGIPNLNELTFGVYKTFVDVGSDYETAVGFIMQPGIARIVDAFNKANSIFQKDFNRVYVETAIKRIAMDLSLVTDNNKRVDFYTPIEEVMKAFEFKYGNIFRDLFLKEKLCIEDKIANRVTLSLDNTTAASIPFSKDFMKMRLAETGIFETSPVEGIDAYELMQLYDLTTIIQYYRMSDIAENINNYANLLSPDKFGAKQTVFATNKIFDDIETVRKRKFLRVYGDTGVAKDLLEAVYPDIDKGLYEYAKSENNESAYPSLHYMLKYSSATSVILGRELFETQNPVFRERIAGIAEHLGVRLTEDLYDDFQTYVFGHMFTSLFRTTSGVVEGNNEINRIFGYGLPLKSDFKPSNINNPTQEDKDAFDELSPAQKVLWIQSTFRDAGIFKFLNCNVFNSNAAKGELIPHTIRFDTDNVNIEVALDEFSQAYFNNNWFVENIANDLINYAAVVEHFTMRKNGISRIISNAAIRDSGLLDCIDIMKSNIINELFNDDSVYTDYVRSHVDTVRKIKNRRGPKGNFVFNVSDGNMHQVLDMGSVVAIPEGESTEGMKLGIVDVSGDEVYYPNYIRINTNNRDILYKAYETENGLLYYYPINILETDEHGPYSANQINNKYYKEETYKQFANYLSGIRKEQVAFTKEDKYHRIAQPKLEQNFDINRPPVDATYGFREVVNKIRDYFKDGYEAALYLRSSTLAGRGGINKKFIRTSSVQEIDGKKYRISYINPVKKVKKIKHGRKTNDYLRYENIPVDNLNKTFADIITRARAEGLQSLNDLFIIEPEVDDVIKHSTASDYTEDQLFIDSALSNIGNSRGKGDDLARKAIFDSKNLAITRNDPSTIIGNYHTATSIVSNYVVNTVNNFLDKIKEYYIDDEQNVYSIDEDYIFEKMKTDESFRKDFFKFCCDVNSFISNFDSVLQLNVSSENQEINDNFKNMKTALTTLRSADGVFANAQKKAISLWLKDFSSDPLIQGDLLTLTDGFNNIGRLESWITDAEEAGVPLMQVIFKEVTKDIRSKDMMSLEAVREYKSKIAELSKGRNINYDHIIDSMGRFIQNYTNKLREDLGKFASARQEAMENPEGVESLEYLKADFAYRKFINDNFEQKYKKEYYDRSLANEQYILENYPEIYQEYIKLNNRRRQIKRSTVQGSLSDEQKAELRMIKLKIDALSSETIDSITDEGDYRVSGVAKPGKEFTNNKIKNKEAAEALSNYLKELSDINNVYFDSAEMEGFRETLEKNLRIIAAKEKRDKNGVITESLSLIAEDEEYRKAKKWRDENAVLRLSPELKKVIDLAFDKLHEDDTKKSERNIYTKFNIYDQFGAPDGTKLTDDQIDVIKKHQMKKYGYYDTDSYSEHLISNKTGDGIVYNEKWRKGLGVGRGVKNAKYTELVNKINAILKKCYDSNTGSVRTSQLSIEDLENLEFLYDELAETKKIKRTKTEGKRIYKFISKEVEFRHDEKVYNRELDEAKRRNRDTPGYLAAWLKANNEIVENEDGTSYSQPSRFLYSYAIPKGATYEIHRDERGIITDITGNDVFMKYANVSKTIGIKTLNEWTYYVDTEYYQRHKDKLKGELSDEEYNKWYDRNHIYNPITHKYEPISCWRRMEYANTNLNIAIEGLDKGKHGYTWEPVSGRQTYKIKPEYDNDSSTGGKYKKNRGVLVNYRYGSNSAYDNRNDEATPEEKAVRDYMIETLKKYVTTERGKKRVDKGFLPAKHKAREFGIDKKDDALWFARQIGAIGGVVNNSVNDNPVVDDIDYANDIEQDFPMMSKLRGKYGDIKTQDTKPNPKPKKEDYESEEKYNKAIEEYNKIKKENEEILKNNELIHSNLIDRNWDEVMEEFIKEAIHFNAVQDNKYLLYFGLNSLKNMRAYKEKPGRKLFTSVYSRDKRKSTKDQRYYETETYDNAVEVYKTFMRRILYNQFKKDEGYKTTISNIIQNHSSAKFMMLNVTGGIANVTYGENQIMSEWIAKEFFNVKDWARGKQLWFAASPSYFAHMFDEKASNKNDAMIKFFNIIDFDKIADFADTGVQGAFKKFRDKLYILQSGGEHFMQNGVLFSMLVSHRLDIRNGIENAEIVNEAIMQQKAEADAFAEIMEEQGLTKEYNDFRQKIKKDPTVMKEYATRHRYVESDFIAYLKDGKAKEIAKEYKKRRKKYKEEYMKKFNEMETMYDQFKLGSDGYISFASDKLFGKMTKEQAYNLSAEFKNKVQSVNKKIHGWYDRIGAARLEQEWWGSLAMQYHKHIYPGIMKRYRWQGYWNEERRSVEKGCFTALIDFIRFPFNDYVAKRTGMSEESLQTMKGIQNIFKYALDTCQTYKIYWQVLPEYERQNMRRNLSDLAGFISAIAIATATRLIADGDDEDSIWYNLLLYSADRLATESIMYTPTGAINEIKVLWKSPIAAQSTIEDMIRLMGLTSEFLLAGDDFDPYFQSGVYAGEHKAKVWWMRQVPIYRGISHVSGLKKNNSYYKLESNHNQTIAKTLSEYIRGNRGEGNW